LRMSAGARFTVMCVGGCCSRQVRSAEADTILTLSGRRHPGRPTVWKWTSFQFYGRKTSNFNFDDIGFDYRRLPR